MWNLAISFWLKRKSNCELPLDMVKQRKDFERSHEVWAAFRKHVQSVFVG